MADLSQLGTPCRVVDRARQSLDQGYGLVCDLDGRPISDLIVVNTHQEHGVIAHRSGSKAPALAVGMRAALPNAKPIPETGIFISDRAMLASVR
jgi:hypothetical protein